MVVGASGFSKKWPRDAIYDVSDYITWILPNPWVKSPNKLKTHITLSNLVVFSCLQVFNPIL